MHCVLCPQSSSIHIHTHTFVMMQCHSLNPCCSCYWCPKAPDLWTTDQMLRAPKDIEVLQLLEQHQKTAELPICNLYYASVSVFHLVLHLCMCIRNFTKLTLRNQQILQWSFCCFSVGQPESSTGFSVH